jgi:CRISPR-associated protein Csb1
LLAASTELDLFLREGCLLRYADSEDAWMQIPRRGEPTRITLPEHDDLVELANAAAKPLRKKWPKDVEYKFDIKKAKELLSVTVEDEAAES